MKTSIHERELAEIKHHFPLGWVICRKCRYLYRLEWMFRYLDARFCKGCAETKLEALIEGVQFSIDHFGMSQDRADTLLGLKDGPKGLPEPPPKPIGEVIDVEDYKKERLADIEKVLNSCDISKVRKNKKTLYGTLTKHSDYYEAGFSSRCENYVIIECFENKQCIWRERFTGVENAVEDGWELD